MDKNFYLQNEQERKEATNNKIEKMKCMIMDSERCKEIAQKLSAYIADNK